MALSKFIIPPDQAGYSVKDGNEVIATKLAGGASRYRRDIIGATSTVNVAWTIGPDEYRYIRAFYNAIAKKGAVPFSIDLILDRSELTEHKAYFIPGSMSMDGQKGLTYSISAQLEVYPVETLQDDLDFVAVYTAFKETFRPREDQFNKTINVDIPEIGL